MNDKIENAVHLGAIGFGIFEARYTDDAGNCSCGDSGCTSPGKHPVNTGWRDKATTNEDEIRAIFEANPDANYGYAPGPGQFIIDCDVGEDVSGIDTLFDLMTEHGEHIEGALFETWSGGQHIPFSTPSPVGNSVKTFGKGIDIRGVGGYCIGPGSKIQGREYTVLMPTAGLDKLKGLPMAPKWMRDRLSASIKRDPNYEKPIHELDSDGAIAHAKEMLRVREPAIEGGGGDIHTFVTACKLKDLSISADMCMELLMEPGGWNDSCQPPWSAGELELKVFNAYTHGKRRPGDKGQGSNLMLTSAPPVMGGMAVEVQDLAEAIAVAVSEQIGEVEEVDTYADRVERLRDLFMTGTEMMKVKKQPRTLVRNLIRDDGIFGIIAERGHGKSVVMTDLGISLILNEDFCGIPTLRDRNVAFFVGEDELGVIGMFKANLKNRGVSEEEWEEKSKGRLVFVSGVPNLVRDDNDAKAFVELTREKFDNPDTPCVSFLDTWQRATGGASQGEDKEMTDATDRLEWIGKSLDGPVITAFHPPKHDPKTVSGVKNIENVTTGLATLMKDGDGSDAIREFEVIRLKGAVENTKLRFKFETVPLGEEDEHGKERTGVYPECVQVIDPTAQGETAGHEKDNALCYVLSEINKGADDTSMAQVIKQIIEIRKKEETWSEKLRVQMSTAGIPKVASDNLRDYLNAKFPEDNTKVHHSMDGYNVSFEKVLGKKGRFLIVYTLPTDQVDHQNLPDNFEDPSVLTVPELVIDL